MVMAAGEGHRKRMRLMIGQDTMLWLYNIDYRFFYGPSSYLASCSRATRTSSPSRCGGASFR